jgi:hypothetical protein
VRVKAYPRLVRRIIVRALSLYLLFAIIGRFVEEMGAVNRPGFCRGSGVPWVRWSRLTGFHAAVVG